MPERKGFMFVGPLSVTKRQLWQDRRYGQRAGRLLPLDVPHGRLAWGHPPATNLFVLVMLAMFALGAWLLGGMRFDAGLWPLWAMAGVFALTLIANLLFDERLEIDTLARRWCYRRGWHGVRIREEGGGFEDLAGLTLKEFKRPLPNEGTVWVLALDFADGLRFCDLGNPMFAADEAHEEAQRVAGATGLPLNIVALGR